MLYPFPLLIKFQTVHKKLNEFKVRNNCMDQRNVELVQSAFLYDFLNRFCKLIYKDNNSIEE